MIYYDLTDLVNHSQYSNRVSGIQRVVLEIAKVLSKRDDVKFFMLNPAIDKWCTVDGIDFDSTEDLFQFKVLWEYSWIDTGPSKWPEFFRKYKIPAAHGFKKNRYRFTKTALHVPLLNNILYKVENNHLKKVVNRKSIKIENMPKIDKNDSIIICGGIWCFQDQYENFLEKNKDSNLIFYLHDIIPLVVPALVPVYLNNMFVPYVKSLYKYAKVIVTSAKNNLVDYENYIKQTYGYKKQILKAIGLPYGFDFSYEKEMIFSFRPEAKELLHQKYCLCVGSIEPRKNHSGLLNTWYKYINSEKYQGEILVIAGGWGCEIDFVRNSLYGTGLFNGTVRVIERPSDCELAFLYDNCTFTVYPSHYEGWGLPIGESLSFCKPVIYFANSSLEEVSRGLGDVVTPGDYQGLFNAIDKLFHDKEYRLQKVKLISDNLNKLPTWENYGKVFYETIKETVSKS